MAKIDRSGQVPLMGRKIIIPQMNNNVPLDRKRKARELFPCTPEEKRSKGEFARQKYAEIVNKFKERYVLEQIINVSQTQQPTLESTKEIPSNIISREQPESASRRNSISNEEDSTNNQESLPQH